MRLGHLVRTFQQWVNGGLQLGELVSEQVFTGLHSITGYITQVPAGGQQFANGQICRYQPTRWVWSINSNQIWFDAQLTARVSRGWQLGYESTIVIITLRHWCRNGSHVNYEIVLRALVWVCLCHCQSVINHWILDSKRLSGKQIILWPAIWIWIWIKKANTNTSTSPSTHGHFDLPFRLGLMKNGNATCFILSFNILIRVFLQLSMGPGYTLVFAYVLCF